MLDCKENVYALLIAIFNPECSSDMAIAAMHGNPIRKTGPKQKDDNVLEMIAMRDSGMTYKEIGKSFGIDCKTCWVRIHRYLEKKKAAQ